MQKAVKRAGMAILVGSAMSLGPGEIRAQTDPCSGGCRCYGPNCTSTKRFDPRDLTPAPRPRPRPNPKFQRASRLASLGSRIYRRAARTRSPADYAAAARYFQSAYRLWPHQNFKIGRYRSMANYHYELASRLWRRRQCGAAAKHYAQVIRWSKYASAANRRADRANLKNATRCVAAQRIRWIQNQALKKWAAARKAFIASLPSLYRKFDRLTGGYVDAWRPTLNALPAAFQTPKPVLVAGRARIGAAGGVSGKVELCNDKGCRPMKPGGDVFFGERVRTGPDGRLQVMLLDETVFTVGPQSEMYIDKYVYEPFSQAGQITAVLTKGVFRFVTGKVPKKKPDAMKVKLPAGAIGPRGTDFVVRVDPAKRMVQIALYSGKLIFRPGGTSNEIPMAPGRWTVSWTGGTPRKVRVSQEIDAGPEARKAPAKRKAADDRALPTAFPRGFKRPAPPPGAWDVLPKRGLSAKRRERLAAKLARARVALDRGIVAARAKKWDTAVKAFATAVRLTGDSSFRWPHGAAPEALLNLALAYDRQDRQPLTAAFLYRAYLAAAPTSKLAGRLCRRIRWLGETHVRHWNDLTFKAVQALSEITQICTPRFCARYVLYVNAIADYIPALVFHGKPRQAQALARSMAWDSPRMLKSPVARRVMGANYWRNYARRRVLGNLGVALAETGSARAALRYFRWVHRHSRAHHPLDLAKIRKDYFYPRHYWAHVQAKKGDRFAASNEARFWVQHAATGWRTSVTCKLDRNACDHDRGTVIGKLKAIAAKRRQRPARSDMGEAAFRSAAVLSRAALTAGAAWHRYRAIDKSWREFWQRQDKPRPGGCP